MARRVSSFCPRAGESGNSDQVMMVRPPRAGHLRRNVSGSGFGGHLGAVENPVPLHLKNEPSRAVRRLDVGSGFSHQLAGQRSIMTDQAHN